MNLLMRKASDHWSCGGYLHVVYTYIKPCMFIRQHLHYLPLSVVKSMSSGDQRDPPMAEPSKEPQTKHSAANIPVQSLSDLLRTPGLLVLQHSL